MTYLRAVLDEASARYRNAGTSPLPPAWAVALLAVVVIAEDLIG